MNKITNVQLYNFYKRESKIANDEIKNICIKAMNLIKKTGILRTANKEAIAFLKNIIDIKLEKYRFDIRNELHYNITKAIHTSKEYSKVIKNNNTYTCYPFSIVEPSYYEIIINHCLKNNLTIEESVEKLYSLIDSDNKLKLDDFLKSDLNFYYGDVNYIIIRTIAVVDAMKMLLERQDLMDDDKVLVSSNFQMVNNILKQMCELANITDLDTLKKNDYDGENISVSKEQYDLISFLYKQVLKNEKTIEPISQKIWNNFFNTNGGKLIHKLTGDIIESDQMDKICTSFISEKVHFIPNYKGNIGYGYNFDIDNVLAICETDVGSWKVTKEEFIKNGFPSRWQFDGSNIWYEYPYHSKLFSPEYIENKILLNESFAEIVLNNENIKNKPTIAFYTEKASEEEIIKITELALKQNIEIKQITFSNQNKFNK